MKKVLILGGTRFIGRVLVEHLLATQQYELTLYNRGKTGTHLFPNIKRIIGDRNVDTYQQIAKEQWDAVIDLSCYEPNPLTNLVKVLRSCTKRYIFISTVSVYNFKELSNQTKNEDSLLKQYDNSHLKPLDTYQYYGEKKVICEDIVRASGLDAVILRPSIVYGQYDYTDRLYSWLYRMKKTDKFLLPLGGQEKMNFTYVEDLAKIIIASIEIKRHRNIYNVTTHPIYTLRNILAHIGSVLNRVPDFVSIDQEFIKKEGLSLKDFPLYTNFDHKNHLIIDHSKLIQDFEFTPISFWKSINNTIKHAEENDWPIPNTGMELVKESALLTDVTH